MRLVTVPEILKLGPGEQVPAIRGTISEVGKRYAGTNEHGEWSIQNATLQTPEGIIKLKVMNREPLSVQKGCPVWLRSVDGNKGLSGLYAEDDEYRGKSTRIIKVTPSALIELEEPPPGPPADPGSERWTPPQPPTPAAPEPHPTHSTVPPAPSAPTGAQGDHTASQKPTTSPADHALFNWTKLYLRCMEAADWIVCERMDAHKQAMSSDHYQACVSSLFIQATRNGF